SVYAWCMCKLAMMEEIEQIHLWLKNKGLLLKISVTATFLCYFFIIATPTCEVVNESNVHIYTNVGHKADQFLHFSSAVSFFKKPFSNDF
ncbi:hypothetical protein ACJX0J_038592, partial [Zea mays]